jgi:hypothetical protein
VNEINGDLSNGWGARDDPHWQENKTMSALRKLLNSFNSRQSGSRFERYYGGVVGNGSGYPTADEARKDLRSYDASFAPYTWPR